MVRSFRFFATAVFIGAVAAACGSSDGASTGDTSETSSVASTSESAAKSTQPSASTQTSEVAGNATGSGTAEATAGAVDPSLFFDGALADEPTTVDCELDGGATAKCYRMTVTGYPTSHEVGPFCPDTTSDGEDAGGIWFDGDAVYDLTGEFFVDLPELYDDDGWKMYDEDGNILVTETAEEFSGAARPDVDPSLQNHCVEGRVEWLTGGAPITTTVDIPVEPVAADSPSAPTGDQGVTLDGVVIANAAPVSAILGAYTIAAFDDCGGHFNPAEGYHLHGAVGCSELPASEAGDTPMFGYALDGYAVHSPLDAAAAAADLDECNGHTTPESGYHYHANSAEKNQVITCFIGQTVARDNAGPGGPPQGGPPPADPQG